jgi:ferrous iron transport protein B
MDISLLSGVVAKELVVSTLGVMYSSEEAADDPDNTQLQGALSSSVSLPAAVAFMLFILLYFPCIATFVAIKNETGKWKWAIAICAYTMVVAWVCAFIGFHITALLI